jgi:hypothetical protein
MRLTLAIGISALALGWATAANAEYYNRYMAGSWINTAYNDGVCQYYFAYNTIGGETHINRLGDCSRIMIGQDGRPMPVVPTTQVIMRRETVGRAVR